MNVLVLGSGGREHALAWKIAQSPHCEALYIAPGNAGTAEAGQNISVRLHDFNGLEALVHEKKIDLIIVGPEQPLVDGVADFFRQKGIAVVGPGKAGAQLEGSKEFSKRFMQQHGIPTAAFAAFTKDQKQEALDYVQQQSLPVVVKASGLAAGKGVLICQTQEEAVQAVEEMLEGKSFGASGETIVIEEYLDGIEISIFVLTDGKDYKLLPSAKDYKRVGEGDTGLNTGGMGAVSPVPFADEAFIERVEEEVVKPTLRGLEAEGIPYQGFIFIGLMVVKGKPYVLEYNVRMGDPETEVVIPRIESDLLELLDAAARGKLAEQNLEVNPQTCVTIMLVSGGYPEDYEKDKPISGLEKVTDSLIFHAGTRQEGENVLTSGGRVLAITSFGESIDHAVHRSLTNASNIDFDGKYYRTDIGKDLM